jgi:hypothetical protein
LENTKGQIKSTVKPITPVAEEGYYNDATQVDHSLTVKATKPKLYPKIEEKQKMAWEKEEKRSYMVLYVL